MIRVRQVSVRVVVMSIIIIIGIIIGGAYIECLKMKR